MLQSEMSQDVMPATSADHTSRRASLFGLGRFALTPAWKHHLRRLTLGRLHRWEHVHLQRKLDQS